MISGSDSAAAGTSFAGRREVVVGVERLEDRRGDQRRIVVGDRLRIEAGLGDRERDAERLRRLRRRGRCERQRQPTRRARSRAFGAETMAVLYWARATTQRAPTSPSLSIVLYILAIIVCGGAGGARRLGRSPASLGLDRHADGARRRRSSAWSSRHSCGRGRRRSFPRSDERPRRRARRASSSGCSRRPTAARSSRRSPTPIRISTSARVRDARATLHARPRRAGLARGRPQDRLHQPHDLAALRRRPADVVDGVGPHGRASRRAARRR